MGVGVVEDRPDLKALAQAREALDLLADDAYAARRGAPVQRPLTFYDLAPSERQDMTVALLGSLLEWQAFEFLSEPIDAMGILVNSLVGYLKGFGSAPEACFAALKPVVIRYSQPWVDEALERRCPPDAAYDE